MQVAHALEHRGGLGDAANLILTFDRDLQDVRLEASNTGAMEPISVRYDPRHGRFDVTFEITNERADAPARLRYTGTAIETVEAAVLARSVERNAPGSRSRLPISSSRIWCSATNPSP
jgi:flagella basal body P-ring formation protein FlgA